MNVGLEGPVREIRSSREGSALGLRADFFWDPEAGLSSAALSSLMAVAGTFPPLSDDDEEVDVTGTDSTFVFKSAEGVDRSFEGRLGQDGCSSSIFSVFSEDITKNVRA